MATEIKKKKVSIFSIIFKLYIIFVIVWTFFGFETHYVRCSRGSARPKACLSNCRVVMGGIEMYNMDHKEDYRSEYISIDPTGTELSGYYKPISPPDGECHYHYDYENTEVFCDKHGSPSNPKIKEEEEEKKSKLSYALNEYLGKCIRRFGDALTLPFLPLYLLGILH